MSEPRKTVLICDDEPHILESIRYAVSKEGFDHALVGDGITAYQTALSLQPDLMILDLGMPGMTGLEVCRKLRAEPRCADLPIVILTAFGQASDEQEALDAGASRYMAKPFSPRALRGVLREMLGEP